MKYPVHESQHPLIMLLLSANTNVQQHMNVFQLAKWVFKLKYCRCVLPLGGSLVSVAELWWGQKEVVGLCSRQGVQPNHWAMRPQPDKQTLSNYLILFSTSSSIFLLSRLAPPDHPLFLQCAPPLFSFPLASYMISLRRLHLAWQRLCGWVLGEPGKMAQRECQIIFVWTML